jgi:hypothetical protein
MAECILHPVAVRSHHAEDVMQPRVHLRILSPHFAVLVSQYRHQRPEVLSLRLTALVQVVLGLSVRRRCEMDGFRFNDSTGDGPLPPEWAQDRVS